MTSIQNHNLSGNESVRIVVEKFSFQDSIALPTKKYFAVFCSQCGLEASFPLLLSMCILEDLMLNEIGVSRGIIQKHMYLSFNFWVLG